MEDSGMISIHQEVYNNPRAELSKDKRTGKELVDQIREKTEEMGLVHKNNKCMVNPHCNSLPISSQNCCTRKSKDRKRFKIIKLELFDELAPLDLVFQCIVSIIKNNFPEVEEEVEKFVFYISSSNKVLQKRSDYH